MYESPIHIIDSIVADCIYELRKKQEDNIYQAILKNTVTVDKDELIKALKYDRDQYNKGYADAMAEIVRCKDCAFFHPSRTLAFCERPHEDLVCRCPDDFCSRGVRKGDGE